MATHSLSYLLLSDLFRYEDKNCKRKFVILKNLIFNPGFKTTFYFRLCHYFSNKNGLLGKFGYGISLMFLHHCRYKYGIQVAPKTKIGSGLRFFHFGTIVINGDVIIGKNCCICQGVTIGSASRGKNMGCPIIGDNVYIGPGAKVFGAINVGDNVAIGANCVVTKDIPDNAVVIGIPGRIISYKGSEGYVDNVDYETLLKPSHRRSLISNEKDL